MGAKIYTEYLQVQDKFPVNCCVLNNSFCHSIGFAGKLHPMMKILRLILAKNWGQMVFT